MPARLEGSYYEATARRERERAPLKGDQRFDVGVIGGGYTGLSAALHLRARGLPEKEAEALLIRAFVGEAIESIANDDLREIAIAAAQRWLEARA